LPRSSTRPLPSAPPSHHLASGPRAENSTVAGRARKALAARCQLSEQERSPAIARPSLRLCYPRANAPAGWRPLSLCAHPYDRRHECDPSLVPPETRLWTEGKSTFRRHTCPSDSTNAQVRRASEIRGHQKRASTWKRNR
jgi:hypothetical protein